MKIQILGPIVRNKNILEVLRKKHEVSITEYDVTLVELESKGVEFIISNGYAPILKSPIIDSYRYKIVNIHPSYLPYGRGIYPNFWCFFEGFPIGATIHYIDEGIDTGPIIVREKMDCSRSETLRTTNDKLVKLAEHLFVTNADKILSDNMSAIEQVQRDNDRYYHSRYLSEYFIEMLPNKWHTKIDHVQKMGRDFLLSADCINQMTHEIESQHE